jgi:hypothetical protein
MRFYDDELGMPSAASNASLFMVIGERSDMHHSCAAS